MKPNVETVQKNLTIWRALNMLDRGMYHEAINHGQGLGCEPSQYEFMGEWSFTYFHNSWDDLMPALLLVKKDRVEITDFGSAYDELFKICEEMTKHFPKTVWFLENENKEWVTSNYKDFYDKDKATEESKIPTTKDPLQALSFDTRMEADDYLRCSFQARHISYGFGLGFKPKEHECHASVL